MKTRPTNSLELSTLLIFSLSTVPALSQTCLSPPEGLIGWWPGDGNPSDIVGGNDGILRNGATFASGIVTSGTGEAFNLDGVDDYIDLGIAPAPIVNDFTIDAWVFIDPLTNTSDRRVVSMDDIFVEGPDLREAIALFSTSPFHCSGASGRPAFAIGVLPGKIDGVCAPSALTTGWHHLAGVRTVSPATISLYVDGAEVASSASSVTETLSLDAPWVIGQVSPAYNGQYFSGRIDEVEFFDRAVTDAEVRRAWM